MKRHTFTVYVDVDDDAAAAFDGEAVARVLDDVLDNASGLTANLREVGAWYHSTDYKGALMAVSPMAIGVVAAGNAAAAYQRGTIREDEVQGEALRGLAEEIARRAKR